MEKKHPDSLLTVVRDFNWVNFTHKLLNNRQHIKCPTGNTNTLECCCTVLKDAYHSVPCAAFGRCDQCRLHLIPTHRQKLKTPEPVVRMGRKWTDESEIELQACFDCSDRSVLVFAASDPDELTDTVTILDQVQTKAFCTFNNNKTWFTPKLRQLHQAKEEACISLNQALC